MNLFQNAGPTPTPLSQMGPGGPQDGIGPGGPGMPPGFFPVLRVRIYSRLKHALLNVSYVQQGNGYC